MTAREWPILFSAEMVRALLAWRKTQTRRLDKRWLKRKRGDRLWAKETWRMPSKLDSLSPLACALRCIDAGYRRPWAPIEYLADGYCANWEDRSGPWSESEWGAPGKTRVSIHMPRWASRVTLELTEDARAERLQDITGEDAIAEGVQYPVSAPDANGMVKPLFSIPEGYDRAKQWWGNGKPTHDDLSRVAYSLLWDSINDDPGDRWDDNPEVAVLTFRMVET